MPNETSKPRPQIAARITSAVMVVDINYNYIDSSIGRYEFGRENAQEEPFRYIAASDLSPHYTPMYPGAWGLKDRYLLHLRAALSPEPLELEIRRQYNIILASELSIELPAYMSAQYPLSIELPAYMSAQYPQHKGEFSGRPTYVICKHSLFEGKKGTITLHQHVEALHKQVYPNDRKNHFNRIYRDALNKVASNLGIESEELTEILGNSRSLKVKRSTRLIKLLERVINESFNSFAKKIESAQAALVAHSKEFGAVEPYARLLSDKEAAEHFWRIYDYIPDGMIAKKLVGVILQNPDLTIIVIDGPDVSNHYHKPLENGVKGFADGTHSIVIAADVSRIKSEVISHESAHNLCARIYENESKPYPKRQSGDFPDPRFVLLGEAFRADIEKNSFDVKKSRQYRHLD